MLVHNTTSGRDFLSFVFIASYLLDLVLASSLKRHARITVLEIANWVTSRNGCLCASRAFYVLFYDWLRHSSDIEVGKSCIFRKFFDCFMRCRNLQCRRLVAVLNILCWQVRRMVIKYHKLYLCCLSIPFVVSSYSNNCFFTEK